MNKYLTLFALSWQKNLEVRGDFIFERARSLSILFSLYFLWSALLQNQTNLLGYSRTALLTYVLVQTLLRAFVLAAVTDRIPSEIARGKLSEILLRPISHFGYWGIQDVSAKALNMIASVLEVGIFMLLVSAPFQAPTSWTAWAGFLAAAVGGMIIYFQMSYMLGVLGFWTAQSWGPRFCFEILLEFCAGSYFPIDILPATAQKIINVLPFPYLIFHPISIFLGRTTGWGIVNVLAHQAVWMVILAVLGHLMWGYGLRKYAAEGG